MNHQFPPWPSYSADEIAAVEAVLSSNQVNYWTGNQCRLFEKEFADWVSAKHAVSLANGTVALDISLKALGIGSGDEVIVTPRSFIASVSCVLNAGATPVFADVDIDTGNITAKSIESKLSSRTKAIICVHLAGWPCDMDEIMALAKMHNLKVIEDCAQAHGATYKGRMVGSIGHIGAWSFCQDKIMTTGGEGGMVTTNDATLWDAMWSFKDHGKSFEAVYEKDHAIGFRWLHENIGTNWRMIEMQAAIGRIQLKKMSQWTLARNQNAQILRDALTSLNVLRMPSYRCSTCTNECGIEVNQNLDRKDCDSGCTHAYYKFYAYINPEMLADGWDREKIIQEIIKVGIPCGSGSCSEIYLEKAFDRLACRPTQRLPNAKELGETAMAFVVHPTIAAEQMRAYAEDIRQIFIRASK
jgi:dTDP-4-amino-4,6-dideoxygalactose transaminase